ncbi:DUF4157 domain-containing protein [Pleurocapsales cyanobacterium LEGE 10410]|nr:DUF4157 domain-containing protein [Pleurocapsales cyanobacterium LEGE 10410]
MTRSQPIQSRFQPRSFEETTNNTPELQQQAKTDKQSQDSNLDSNFNFADIDILPQKRNKSLSWGLENFQSRQHAKTATPIRQAKLTIGQPNDRYEQEADLVAERVVKQINAPTSAQRTQNAERDKPKISTLQRQAEENVQPKQNNLGLKRSLFFPIMQRVSKPEEGATSKSDINREATTDLATEVERAKGQGKPLETDVRQSMGQAMGVDFSRVRVHTDAHSDRLNKSIQAKAFTTGQDIFFRQDTYSPKTHSGQLLLAHELTHTIQQASAPKVQRKYNNIPELSAHLLTKSIFGPLKTTRSQHIQESSEKYNQLQKDDKNYSKQRELLTNIISNSKDWLKEYQNSEKEEVENKRGEIGRIALAAESEMTVVDKQEGRKGKRGEVENDYSPESLKDSAKDSALDFANGMKDSGSSGKNLYNNSKELLEAIKKSAESNSSLFSESNSGTKEITNNFQKSDGLTEIAHDNTLGGKLDDFKNQLKKFSFVGPVIAVIKGICDSYTAWKEWRSFANTSKTIKAEKTDNKENSNITAALEDAIVHGHGKIRRRFWNTIKSVVSNIIDVVAYVLAATGLGAAVGALTKLATGIVSSIEKIAMKIKGLWKFIKKTRGVHRKQSADTLVQEGLKGNQISLQILIDLDPIGMMGRAAIGAKHGKDRNREAEGGKTGALKKGLKGAWKEVWSGESKIKDIDKMEAYLKEVKAHPEKMNIDLNEFTKKVADKLKSQA